MKNILRVKVMNEAKKVIGELRAKHGALMPVMLKLRRCKL